MKASNAVKIDCPRCGDELTLPIAVEGPFTAEDGSVYANVTVDAERTQHRCTRTHPRNRRPKR